MKPQQRDIVRYWHLLELFSTQKVDPPESGTRRRPVDVLREGHPVPWESLPAPGLRGKYRWVWQHTVYLSVYWVSGIYEHLHEVFPRDEDAYDEHPGGRSACAALVVDQHGRYIADSAVLSSALWGSGRTIDPGVDNPEWFDGFDDADRRFRAAIGEHLADVPGEPDEDQPPLGPAELRELLAVAVEAAGVKSLVSLHSDVIQIASTAVREDQAQDLPGFDFLNSFHLNDLRAVAEGGVCGAALSAYLTLDEDVRVSERVDVRRSPDQVVAGISIKSLPRGRWPADPRHPLSTSQQFAVNQALGMNDGRVNLLGSTARPAPARPP